MFCCIVTTSGEEFVLLASPWNTTRIRGPFRTSDVFMVTGNEMALDLLDRIQRNTNYDQQQRRFHRNRTEP